MTHNCPRYMRTHTKKRRIHISPIKKLILKTNNKTRIMRIKNHKKELCQSQISIHKIKVTKIKMLRVWHSIQKKRRKNLKMKLTKVTHQSNRWRRSFRSWKKRVLKQNLNWKTSKIIKKRSCWTKLHRLKINIKTNWIRKGRRL